LNLGFSECETGLLAMDLRCDMNETGGREHKIFLSVSNGSSECSDWITNPGYFRISTRTTALHVIYFPEYLLIVYSRTLSIAQGI
jgi:hypothetical protein